MTEVTKETLPQENKMGIMPVGRLLVNISLPIMLASIIQAIYNVVDSIFISQIGENALAAISIAFPLHTLMFSVASGTGVGINALLSRRLGEKNYAEANRIAQNGMFLAGLSWLVFVVVGVFLTRTYYQFQTDDLEIIAIGAEYSSICLIFSFGMFGQITFEKFLLSTGRSGMSMVSLMISAVIKIVIDPLFIFGWLGFPALGVTGGAVSTVVGQLCGVCIAFFLNTKYNKEVNLFEKGFRPRASTIGDIYKVGIPSIVMSSVGSVMTFCMNRILLSYTSTATAVFGTYFRLQSFFVMPILGINNGVVSIVSYNYGAGKKQRIIKTIRLSIFAAMGLLLLSFSAMQLFPRSLLSLFNASEEMILIGTNAFRRITLSYLFAGPVIILTAVFQALGRSLVSLLISAARQLVILLPCAYLFSELFGLHSIWWSYPVAEIVALILSLFFYRSTYSKTIRPMLDREESPLADAP